MEIKLPFNGDAYFGGVHIVDGRPEYWIGMIFPVDTAVPDGFDYVDLEPLDFAVCYLYGKEGSSEFYTMETHDQAWKVWALLGVTPQTFIYYRPSSRMDYTKNRNSVLLKGMRKHEDLTFDYYVHIDRKMETEFSALLFKRIVREVKRNCVRIKYNTPVYIGKEMYKNKKNWSFPGNAADALP